ncbi:MAG: FAD-binding protein [Proteobacteria bacterium]|nr:FAD-binding protein [Pseudomonadota bacterium]
MKQETLQTDVLVVGGGGAASRAAYEAKHFDPGLDVTVAVEGEWGKCGSTVWVASEALGINAPLNAAGDGDSPEVFLDDILETGLGLANRSLAEKIAFESSDRISELVELGVEFDSTNEKIRQRKLSGCTKARSLSQGGQTGVAIVSALKRASLEKGVNVLEGIRIVDLIHKDGEVWGARGLRQGEQIDILAKAVILANGGAGAIFPHNINHSSLRGDGYSMAYRAGALLTNMEFIQIGPGVVFPKMHFIIHSHMWRFSPRLKNSLGKEFLDDYLPTGTSRDEVLSLKAMSFPFSVRTNARYVDISISKEIMSGRGTEHGGVFFDVTHVPEGELREKAPVTYETFIKRGINLCADRIEIAPLVQSFNGGIKIDENAATSVPGLFAVGEVSGGVHGADRPGGNNLADCQVFGYRGGRAAAVLAADRAWKAKEAIRDDKLIVMENSEKIAPIRNAIDRALMVVRQKEDLEELLDKIQSFRHETPTLDVVTDNVLLTAEMVARSAILRQESRGVHYREDFPDSDPELTKSSLVNKGKEGEVKAFFE